MAKDQKSYHLYLYNTDTSLLRSVHFVPDSKPKLYIVVTVALKRFSSVVCQATKSKIQFHNLMHLLLTKTLL